MYEDNDEEYKPDGTERANLAATKYKTEALEEIKAKILNIAAPNGGGLRELSGNIDALSKSLLTTRMKDFEDSVSEDGKTFKYKVPDYTYSLPPQKPPLRPVTISEYVNHHPGTQVVGKGRFHQWGVDVDHADMGSGTYSIAIVEMEDGTVRSVAIDLIKFED